MTFLINKLNTWRDTAINKSLYNFYLSLIYFIRDILGYCKGLFHCLTGKIRYEGVYRPLVIGAGSELLVRPGSAIILKNGSENQSSDTFHNNSIFQSATTIGTRPHYIAIDPPALNTTRIELLGNAELILEPNTIILSGTYISASNNAKVSIGENSYLSQEIKINSRNGVTIGKNALIGYQVMMMDYEAHTIFYNDNLNDQLASDRKNAIVIGDNVWIGVRVTILKGVTIGSGSIIGANSCVVSDIPENCIAVGNPAKVIRNNIKWQR